jgi:hypothetical protein
MKKFVLLIAALMLLILSPSHSATSEERVGEIMDKISAHFDNLKDATADITIDYNLYLFGCSGNRRMQGKGWWKYPDKIKSTMDGITYFAKGNRIRKIDEKGKRLYIRMLNSVNFAPGFHPGLIPYNFYLTLLQDGEEEIIIKGIPKPGTLKNVTKVIFHIDPKEYLIRYLDITVINDRLSGKMYIDYEKIDGIWVPVGFHGKSAIELASNMLVGLGIKLKGENIKLNTGLPDKIFNPGF